MPSWQPAMPPKLAPAAPREESLTRPEQTHPSRSPLVDPFSDLLLSGGLRVFAALPDPREPLHRITPPQPVRAPSRQFGHRLAVGGDGDGPPRLDGLEQLRELGLGVVDADAD